MSDPAAQTNPASEPVLPTQLDLPTELDLEPLKGRIQKAADAHKPELDCWAFNVGTLATLIMTAAASICSSQAHAGNDLGAWGAGLAAAAGVFVAAERSLAFGARWRFHEEMRNRYNALIDQIEFIQYLPDAEKAKYLQEIWASLYALRARDAAIPGTGTAPQ